MSAMTRLAWLTDIHLDFVPSEEAVATLCDGVAETRADAVLLGGDIATARTVERNLRRLETCLQRPIYFVLGNHDFYGGRIRDVRQRVADLCRPSRWLHWLPEAGIVELNDQTALVGHESWADGRLGHGRRSAFIINDYFCIEDFQDLSHDDWFAALGALGDEAAAFFRELLPRAFDGYRHVLLLTHVPPFREAAWHQGRTSDDDALPHFACSAVGDVLKQIMTERPQCRLTVLCGHTHGAGVAQILPNLDVHTGGAEYGAPAVQPHVVVI